MHVVIDWTGGRATLGAVDTVGLEAPGRCGAVARVASDSLLVVGQGAQYDPSRAMIPPSRVGDELHFVLTPRVWAIHTGAFAGDTVPISPTAALRRAPERGSFGR